MHFLHLPSGKTAYSVDKWDFVVLWVRTWLQIKRTQKDNVFVENVGKSATSHDTQHSCWQRCEEDNGRIMIEFLVHYAAMCQ